MLEKKPPKSRSRPPIRLTETRRMLALLALLILGSSAAAALWVPGGKAIFDALLPVLSVVLLYYFPQR